MYIRDPNTTLNFDLKVKYRVFDIFSWLAKTIFWFDIGFPYLAHAFITWCVANIHDPYSTLTFDLKVNFIGFCRLFFLLWHWHTALCFGHSVFVRWHSYTMFGTWVYQHGTMCSVHSWPLYGLDLLPQYKLYIFPSWISAWQDYLRSLT